MKKLVGFLLLVLAVTTVIGMKLNNDTYWSVYNYATIVLSVIFGIALLRQR